MKSGGHYGYGKIYHIRDDPPSHRPAKLVNMVKFQLTKTETRRLSFLASTEVLNFYTVSSAQNFAQNFVLCFCFINKLKSDMVRTKQKLKKSKKNILENFETQKLTDKKKTEMTRH